MTMEIFMLIAHRDKDKDYQLRDIEIDMWYCKDCGERVPLAMLSDLQQQPHLRDNPALWSTSSNYSRRSCSLLFAWRLHFQL